MIVWVSLFSKKERTSPRGMSYNFRKAAIGNGEGVSKNVAKGQYKRQGEFEDDPFQSTQNPCKSFWRSLFPVNA